MKVVTASDLRSKFNDCLICYRIAVDTDYALPTRAWLSGPFWTWFQQMRWNLGLTKWERTNDCDNFARAYAQAAADCYALTPWPDGSPRPESIAVGELFYIRKDGAAHAICVAVTESDLTFVEPQTGQFLTLDPEELASCFFVRF